MYIYYTKQANMHIEKFKTPLTLQDALNKIASNTNQSFDWYPVWNGKCYLEVGGNCKKIGVYVLNVESGKLVVYQNQFVRTDLKLEYESDNDTEGVYCISSSEFNGDYNKITKDKFIKLLKKDFSVVKIEIKTLTREIEYSVVNIQL